MQTTHTYSLCSLSDAPGAIVVQFTSPLCSFPIRQSFTKVHDALRYAMHKDLELLRTLIMASPWADDHIKALMLNTTGCTITLEYAHCLVERVYKLLQRSCIDKYSEQWQAIDVLITDFLTQYSANF